MEDVRAVVLPQQPRGNDKVKNEAQRRNRRVLGDIGNNLEAAHLVEGKPPVQISRPMTRSFHAQLLAKAQAKAEKNNGNPVLPVLEDRAAALNRKRGPAKKAAVAPKKAIEKPISETLVVISSDEEEEKEKPVNRCKSVEGPSRKEVKTLTSILTARSKAMACGVDIKPKEKIVDFDSADVSDELAVVEYIDDLYQFYKLTEDDSRVHDYMESQPDINPKMRSILIDWLVEVHRKFELMPETFYLTVNIIDRYLSMKIVSRRELQLVGISSMVIASKYEEIWAPQVIDFVCLSDYAYTGDQILLMEKAILGKLEWYLTVPTPYVFLSRYIKASVSPGEEVKNMVFFLAELGIMHYPTTIRYSPSLIAAAAVYAARCTLNKAPFWTETLKHHTGYSEEQLRDCAKLLVGFHLNAAESNLQAVYRKFSKPEHVAVARIPPAKSFLSSSS
ncbi:G2/mitotic-specific cyclin S13-7 [Prunus yedoensis var. nudiflora]|uniref:B-like cyclin n=1 Tax=Prunus yedoensis var. nudiflora TaxID=2094558 RepID=A0A314U8T0_PRUYE|nr:G2/mitotic-specific cyclin S13-7 [Prunus yedoensis var. nudiflora]